MSFATTTFAITCVMPRWSCCRRGVASETGKTPKGKRDMSDAANVPNSYIQDLLELHQSSAEGFRGRLVCDLERVQRSVIMELHAMLTGPCNLQITDDPQLFALVLRAHKRCLEPPVESDVFPEIEEKLQELQDRLAAPWDRPWDLMQIPPAYTDFRTWRRTFDELPENERRFVRCVTRHPGSKLSLGGFRENAMGDIWTRPEKLGLIICVGSYKWISTMPDPLA